MTIRKTKKSRNKLRITSPIWPILILLALFIALFYYLTSPIETKKTLYLSKGKAGHIISQLAKDGYDVGIIDEIVLALIGNVQSGWLDIGKRKIRRIDFLYKLTSSKSMIHKLTLIPGKTNYLFFQKLAKELDLNTTKLQEAYDTLSKYPEAGIYADTYHLPHGIKEKKLISYLVNISEKKYQKLSYEAFGDYNQTKWQRILTIASIIQKEAANNKEMPLVASVIYNRLEKNMPLQMDGTLNYGKYAHVKVTPKRIKEDNSTFNTYKHKGLPPSPIGAVSSHAIDAAIYPAKTNYLYFMRNKNGVHDFTDTFKKHRKNIEKVK